MSRTVLVTGSSRGIGRATALAFARDGYDVAVNCASSAAQMAEVKKEIEALGSRCLAVRADVGNPEECRRMFDAVRGAFGSLDVLVNNAGISKIGLLQDMDIAEWDRLLRVNLTSVFLCCKYAIPDMVRAQRGTIINISSVWGVCGASCEAAYSASKGGVNALTRALAKELAPSNVQVNAIACGAIDTEMNQFLDREERDALSREIPAGRMGRPEEAAALALSLATSGPYLTGQIIRLDGGWI